jgi:hypothetical protein
MYPSTSIHSPICDFEIHAPYDHWTIFGPNKENDSWRMKTNQELNQLINYKNIINCIRARRLSWLGHVERMPTNRSIKSLFSWKPLYKTSGQTENTM